MFDILPEKKHIKFLENTVYGSMILALSKEQIDLIKLKKQVKVPLKIEEKKSGQ